MSDQPESSSTFAKVFIPGLVIGLIVGLAVGVLVVPLLDSSPSLKPVSGGVKTPADKRNPHPAEVKPAEKPADIPADKPTDKPSDKPVESAPKP